MNSKIHKIYFEPAFVKIICGYLRLTIDRLLTIYRIAFFIFEDNKLKIT